jgi:hypothetical protein
LQHAVSGAEPAGRYTLFYALTEPGTLNIIGTLGQTAFALHYPETLVDRLTADPAVLQHQVSAPVTFRAYLTGYEARPVESVEVQEHDDRDNAVASYGFMRDDGTNGDATARDGIFTLQTSLMKSGPRYLSVRASVRFAGEQTSNLSQPLMLPVAVTESVSEVRTSLASALDAMQRTTAYERLGQRFNAATVLDGLSPFTLRALAAALRRCTPTDSSEFHSVCVGAEDLPSGSTQRHFLFVRDAVGVWRLIAW